MTKDDDHDHGSHDHDDHDAHDAHDDHDAHPPEDPRWVLLPLAVGLVAGVIVLVLLGLSSGATPFS